jgi:hypothetical protein
MSATALASLTLQHLDSVFSFHGIVEGIAGVFRGPVPVVLCRLGALAVEETSSSGIYAPGDQTTTAGALAHGADGRKSW